MAQPDQLGKYRITGVLGEGAMGVVYRGFDPDIRRVVALKTIRRGGDSGESSAVSAARFRNEARSAGRLSHPGLVGVYDFGESDGPGGRVTYIAMEYVEGHNLAAYLARPVAFGIADIASVVAQLLDALAHAHEHAVWHRDIKPANIILTPTGRVKIADFGIARFEDSGLTMAGGMVGTPIYMSPEQYLGAAIDHRVDLYAVGVVLFQMLVGRPPFVGSTDSLTYRVVHEEAPLPSQVPGATLVLPHLDAAVARALAKRPDDRWPTAMAFRSALEAALGRPAPALVSPAVAGALGSGHDFDATLKTPVRGGGSSAPATSLAGRPAASPSAAPSAPDAGVRPDAGSGSASGPLPHWDAAVLAQVEAMLARHVGPLAGTMVRRAARECADLPALQSRLAEQIAQSSVRQAFLSQVRAAGTPSASSAGSRPAAAGALSSGAAAPAPGPATSGARPAPGPVAVASGSAAGAGGATTGALVSEAWLEQAQRVLAQHLGPIARIVLKRACERTRHRNLLLDVLTDAAPEAARQRLRADLDRLV